MIIKKAELSRALVALAYPTPREVGEFLRLRDQDFAVLQPVQIRFAMNRCGLPGLGFFDTAVHFARFRYYFCYPRPLRCRPAIDTVAAGLRKDIESFVSTSGVHGHVGGLDIIKDASRPVWYVVDNDRLMGVFDRGGFRLPSVRYRSWTPQSPWGDGWSETAYVSHEVLGDDGDFLKVWVT